MSMLDLQTNATDAALLSAVPPIEVLPRPSRVTLSQRRLWFLSRLLGGSKADHINMGLRLRAELHEATLSLALDGLVAHHEVPRTIFSCEPFQPIGPADVGLPLKRDDRAPADVEAKLAELTRHEARAAFDLEAGLPIRGRLVCMAVDDHVLLFTLYKVVSDDSLPRIVTRGLSNSTLRPGKAAQIGRCGCQRSMCTTRFGSASGWQARCWSVRSGYWLRLLASAPPMLELPMDRLRPAQQDYSGSYVVLQETLTAQVEALRLADGMTLFSRPGLVAGAGAVVGSGRAGDRHTEHHSRYEIEGMIGYLTAAAFEIGGIPISLAILLLMQLSPYVRWSRRTTDMHGYHPVEPHGCDIFCAVSFARLRSFRLPPCTRPAKASQMYSIEMGFAKRSGSCSPQLAALIVVTLTSLLGTFKLFLRFLPPPLVQAGSFSLINTYLDFHLLEEASPLAAWTYRRDTGGARRVVVFD
ncbi:condensation domain-containing protein [Mesorhizobium sp. M0040]|uniref:condensation domain-containing protein n=1 Tax=Mesorhizobium sp. M0040 TaxID=2956855 RepID=UPI00333593A2